MAVAACAGCVGHVRHVGCVGCVGRVGPSPASAEKLTRFGGVTSSEVLQRKQKSLKSKKA
eukprot:847202-Prymnesium_polylepis.1